MTQEDHFDVASYALGVLDQRDAGRFEDHLIDCPQCAYELDSFLQVSDLLAHVDPAAVIAAEESRRDGMVLRKVIGEVRHERRRSNSRRLYSLAAAVVVFAMLSIGAFFVGGQLNGDKTQPTNNAGATSQTAGPEPGSGTGLGFGGPDLPGTRYEGANARTGVKIAVGLESTDFGTSVHYTVGNIKGPLTCRLVLMHSDGSAEPLGSWKVPEKGWGTAENPTLTMLTAPTATPSHDIASVLVQDAATGKTLVSTTDQ
jgi:hypothetical protein